MNWRKSVALSFLPLLVLVALLLKDNKSSDIETNKVRRVASVPKKNNENTKIPKVFTRRSILFPERHDQNSFLRNRIPQSLEKSFEKLEDVRVTEGYEYIANVGAIAKKDFRPELGEVISDRAGLVYFRTSQGHSFIPVALSKITNTLYPISSILHIKGATPEIRSEVMGRGFKEYYYHGPLKFLSIKSTSGEVVKLYSELKQQGFKVELEVLKPQHKSI
jgi:hypothetical protein